MLRQEKNYNLVVGAAQTNEMGNGQVYQVVNRKTGVVEAESRILAQAFDYIKQLQKALDDHKTEETQEESSPQVIFKPYQH